MTVHESSALRTGRVFENMRSPEGPLWAQLSDLEDEMARHLMPHPLGTVFVSESTGWALAKTDDFGLCLIAGAVQDGELLEPCSRFDLGLGYVDVGTDELVSQIAVLNNALGKLEEGLALDVLSVSPLLPSTAQLRKLRTAVLEADASAQFIDPESAKNHVFLGTVAAVISPKFVGFAQHLGRSLYAIHNLPAPPVGAMAEVKYCPGREPDLHVVPANTRTRGLDR